MKRFISILLTLILVLSMTATAFAADYTVVKGDTLNKIAQKYDTTWRELSKLNNIASPYTIYPGQKIKLPGDAKTTVEDEYVNWTLPKSVYELLNKVNLTEAFTKEEVAVYNSQLYASYLYDLAKYPDPEEFTDQGNPKGKVVSGTMEDSEFYPGTSRIYKLYIPAQYDASKPANFVLIYDGQNYKDDAYPKYFNVFDNMIAAGELEPTIVLLLAHGTPGPGQPILGYNEGEVNRSYEYDSISDWNARFITEEVMPTLLKDYNISKDPADNMVMGCSSSGIAAFETAWYKTDVFGKVYMSSPTFVDIRFGNVWPSAIRMSDKKDIKIFTICGIHDLDNVFGSWLAGNYDVGLALEYKGYDYRYYNTEGGHGSAYSALLPDALRWLYNDVECDAENIELQTFPELIKGN